MCEFCTQHGEGKKWYLNAENYSRDMIDQDGRRPYITEFLNGFERRTPGEMRQVETLAHSVIASLMNWYLTRNQKKNHFGQIVMIEEVEQVFKLAEGVVRLPCVCRRVTTGIKNARYCFGLTLDKRLHESLDDSFSLEILSPEQALETVRKFDKEGLVHSVWTFKTPYIGGLCNCDHDCMAYRVTHEQGYFQTMFRGEHIAFVDPDACNGCKVCIRQCQFGAIRFSAANKKVLVDPTACYGCGVCRAACHRDAILLRERVNDPLASRYW